MRLHFSIGDYDYRRTIRFCQSIHFSITQVFFADHVHWRTMCIDARESTTNSRSPGSRFDAGKERRILLFLASFFEKKKTLLDSFHCFAGTLLLPLCLLWRPILKIWSVGTTLMRFTWANMSERRILVSNLSVTCSSFCEFHTLDWRRHVCAFPLDSFRRRHVLKYATQLPCIRRLTFTWTLSIFYHSSSQFSPVDRDICR